MRLNLLKKINPLRGNKDEKGFALIELNGNLEWPMVGLENRPKKGFREELKAN
jgi:hypothetical protein